MLEGDQTGQELLEEALRILAPDVIGIEFDFPRFDLSLESRRETKNQVVYEAASSEAQTQKQLVTDLLDRVFDGSAAKLVLQALSAGKATPSELAEIRKLLDKHRGSRK